MTGMRVVLPAMLVASCGACSGKRTAATGEVEVVLDAWQGESWWGAGVTTRAQGME